MATIDPNFVGPPAPTPDPGSTVPVNPAVPAASDPNAGANQASTEAVARQLLGDSLVERYGDVIGVRQPTWRDGVRDFSLGVVQGADRTREMQAQLRKEYRTALGREGSIAVQREKENRAKATSVVKVISDAQKLPVSQRKTYVREMMKQLGIEPSATAMQMFTDAETVSKLPMEDLARGTMDGSLTFDEVANVMGSPQAAVQFQKSVIQMQGDRLRNQKLVLEINNQNAKEIDRQTKAASIDSDEDQRRQWVQNKVGSVRVTGADGQPRLATIEEVDKLSRQMFPGAAAGPAIVSPVKPSVVPTPTKTPKAVQRPDGTVGIFSKQELDTMSDWGRRKPLPTPKATVAPAPTPAAAPISASTGVTPAGNRVRFK